MSPFGPTLVLYQLTCLYDRRSRIHFLGFFREGAVLAEAARPRHPYIIYRLNFIPTLYDSL